MRKSSRVPKKKQIEPEPEPEPEESEESPEDSEEEEPSPEVYHTHYPGSQRSSPSSSGRRGERG